MTQPEETTDGSGYVKMPPPAPLVSSPKGFRMTTSQSRSSLLRTGSGSQLLPPENRSLSRKRRVASSMEDEADEDMVDELTFDNVVKVYATIQEPDFSNPWQTKSIENARGSGVAIQTGNGDGVLRILTAAHVVADQTFVQVQRLGVEKPDKYVATVFAVSHECDLALLAVENAADFWKDLEPAPLGRIPSRRSIVLVAGFPVGGEELSITEGVVSRIEGQSYSHSERRLLAVTVDAAINQGNSGGPAFNTKGELIGIAFQGLEGASNIGHIVPPPVIQHFLNGLASPGDYRGFPSSGIEWQQLTNPHLRNHLKLNDNVHGVLVTALCYGNTCYGILEKNDVLTHVDNKSVANNGTITFDRYGRLDLSTVFTMYQCGQQVELRLIRDGTRMTVNVTTKPVQRLVPLSQHDRRPPYFCYCGLVFQPLSMDYIDACSSNSGNNPHFIHLLFDGRQSDKRLQVVVLTQTLSDKVNVGYETLQDEEIKKVNGETIRDLEDLVCKVESTTEPIVRFETFGENIIIVPSPNNPQAKIANERILSRYKVGSDRCLD